RRLSEPAEVSRSLARQLADEMITPDEVQLYHWSLSNGTRSDVPAVGEGDLLALASGRLEAPVEVFESSEPALLPAVGAALDAVREGTVPLNLLPVEGRRRYEEGLSIATIVLVAVASVLLLVWGASTLVKDELLRRQVEEALVAVETQVREAKALQDEFGNLHKQVDVLTAGQARRVTLMFRNITALV